MKNTVLTLLLITAWQCYSQDSPSDSISYFEQEKATVERLLSNDDVLDSLVARMIEKSHILQSYEAEVYQNEESIKQQKRSWISSFRIGLNLYSTNTSLDENNNSTTTTGILPNTGLTLSLDPEKFVNRKSYIRQAEYERERAYYRYLDQQRQLKVWMTNQYYSYLQSLESIVIRQSMLDVRRQNYFVVEADFRQGRTPYSTLLVAETALHEAEQSLIEAELTAMSKKKEIEAYLD